MRILMTRVLTRMKVLLRIRISMMMKLLLITIDDENFNFY